MQSKEMIVKFLNEANIYHNNEVFQGVKSLDSFFQNICNFKEGACVVICKKNIDTKLELNKWSGATCSGNSALKKAMNISIDEHDNKRSVQLSLVEYLDVLIIANFNNQFNELMEALNILLNAVNTKANIVISLGHHKKKNSVDVNLISKINSSEHLRTINGGLQ